MIRWLALLSSSSEEEGDFSDVVVRTDEVDMANGLFVVAAAVVGVIILRLKADARYKVEKTSVSFACAERNASPSLVWFCGVEKQ